MNKVNNKALIKDTIMMYLMSIVKLAIPLISLPYLTRVLSVDCYGGVSFGKSLVSIFQIIIDFGFVLSATKDIVEIKNKDGIKEKIGSTFYAQLMLAIMVMIVSFVISFSLEILEGFEWFVILSTLNSVVTIFLFEYVFKAYQKMNYVTIRFVIVKLISLVLTLLFVKRDADILLMPIFDICSSAIAVVMVAWQLKKMCIKIDLSFIRIKEAYLELKKSFVYFVSEFATKIYGVLGIVVVGFVLGKTDVAYWTLAMYMLTAVHVLYNPIVNSVYPEMLKNKSLKLIHKVMVIYIPIILFGCLLVFLFGESVINLFFSDKYIVSAKVFKVMIPVLVLSFVSFMYGSPCLIVLEKQKWQVLSISLGIVVQMLGMAILIMTETFDLTNLAIIRCVSELVVCLARVCVVYKNKSNFNQFAQTKTN